MVSQSILLGVDTRPSVWIGYLRSQGVALIATGLDFAIVVSLVLLSDCSAAGAGALGAGAGGVVSFALNRVFAFCASAGCARRQGFRYLGVWLGSLMLNCLLLWLGSDMLGWPIATVKIMAAALVGTCFNYPLHRAFVFDAHRGARS